MSASLLERISASDPGIGLEMKCSWGSGTVTAAKGEGGLLYRQAYSAAQVLTAQIPVLENMTCPSQLMGVISRMVVRSWMILGICWHRLSSRQDALKALKKRPRRRFWHQFPITVNLESATDADSYVHVILGAPTKVLNRSIAHV